MTDTPGDTLRRRKRATMLGVLGVTFAMVGLSYAAVPLYDLFCRVTGFGGTTQVADAAPAADAVSDRMVTVQFNADVNSALPWTFRPAQREVKVRVGESALAFYRARNDSDVPVTGTATFNVTPLKAGLYFVKVDCFCFVEQTLQPGEEIDMPVSFYVDPEIETDRGVDDVKSITLSYTFFRALDEPEDSDDDGAGSAETAAAAGAATGDRNGNDNAVN